MCYQPDNFLKRCLKCQYLAVCFSICKDEKTSMFRTIPVKLSIAHFPNYSTIIPLNAKDTVTRACAHTDLPVEVTDETYMTYRESVLFSLITQKHIFKTRLNTKSFSVKVCQNLQSTLFAEYFVCRVLSVFALC